jgi:tetratricopeptide (TPR) repeat protein
VAQLDFEKEYSTIITDYLNTKPDSAYLLTRKLVSYSRSTNDTSNLIRSYELLGLCMEIRGRYREAIVQYERALDLAEHIRDSALTASAYCKLGKAHSGMSKFEQAMSYHNKSMNFRMHLGDSVGMAVNCIDISTIHAQLGQYQLALDFLQSSQKDVNKNPKDIQVLANNNFSQVYQNMGDYSQAIEFAKNNLALLENEHDHYLLIDVLLTMGNIQKEFNNKDEAIKHFKTAVQLAKRYQHFHQVATGALLLGQTYIQTKELDLANEYLLDSKESFQLLEDVSGEIQAEIGIAQIDIWQGELASAETRFNYCLQLSEDHKLPLQLTKSILGLAKVNLALNDYHTAKKQALKSIAQAKKLNTKLDVMKGYNVLHQILYNIGEYESALEYLEKFLSLKKELFPNALQKQLNIELSRSEAEKKRVIREEKEKQLAQQKAEKLSRRNRIQYSIISITILTIFSLTFVVSRMKLPNWAIELLVFLPFLLLFEFMLVLTDPHVEAFTNNDPAWKLAFNTLMAALIFPLHSFFEQTIKNDYKQLNG